MSRPVRNLLTTAVVLVGLLVAAAPAGASFHLMKIREIATRDAGNGPDSSYLEVQMYFPGQNLLGSGARLFECDATCGNQVFFPGTPMATSPFTNVANGANQSTVLFADSGFTAAKDFNINLNLDTGTYQNGGALCYVTYPNDPGFNDCVSWGTFNAQATLNTALNNDAGTTAPSIVATPLQLGHAYRRNISANCPTALDGADDTDTSADFSDVMPPAPRPNSVAPTETLCGGGGGGTPGGGGATPSTGTPTSGTPVKKCKKPKKRSASAAKKKCKKKK